jgi:hypothetical protein
MRADEMGQNNEVIRDSGKEVFEVLPIILGGSPVDPQNKVILDRESHIAAVNYWNKIIKNLKDEKGEFG